MEETKTEIEISLAQEEIEKPLLTREPVLFFLHRFRKLEVKNQDHRQLLIDSFINTIYLYDDKMILAFNYKDGSNTKYPRICDRCAGAFYLKQPPFCSISNNKSCPD